MSPERIAGGLLGLAVGDALGAPFEHRTAEQIRMRVPNAGRLVHEPPSATLRYTDDTQMAIGVTEALLSGEPSARDYGAHYFANFDATRGYGGGARKSIAALGRGLAPEDAARIAFESGSYGNGAAMRVAPVGLRFWNDPALCREHARRSALPTHCHALGVEGAVLLAEAVAFVARLGEQTFVAEDYWGALEAVAETPEFRGRLTMARGIQTPAALAELGIGIAALDSAVTAMAAFALFPDDYPRVVGEAVLLGGDCDTIAAMAGAISGARLGIQAIPAIWLERLENNGKGRDHMLKLAARLAAMPHVPSPVTPDV